MQSKLAVEHVLYEFFGKGNLQSYESLVSKDVAIHHPVTAKEIYPELLKGRES